MPKSIQIARNHPVTSFFLISIGVSWILWILAIITPPPLFSWSPLFAYFGPLVAAGAIIRITGGDLQTWVSRIVRWRVAPRWYGLAIGLPIISVVGIVGISIQLGDSLSFSLPSWLQIISRYSTLILPHIVLTIGEEAGWRGFALPRLQRKYDAFIASLIIGVIWGIWSIPLFFLSAPPQPQITDILYVPIFIALSILFTYIYNSTGGSVWITSIFHAGIHISFLASTRLLFGSSTIQFQLVMLAVWTTPALFIMNFYGTDWLSHDFPTNKDTTQETEETDRI